VLFYSKNFMSDNIFNWPILGHRNIVEYLQRCVLNDHLAHAYLFVGPDHVGKQTVARYFMQSILCEGFEGVRYIPCQRCVHCQQYNNRVHPDVNYIERGQGNKSISIDQIRQLIQNLSLKTFISKYKIALVDQAEYLEEEAANALLKTLEEPSGKTVILLIAHTLESLPETIISRCQTVHFRSLSTKTLKEYLQNESGLPLRIQSEISHLAQGKPGKVINWLHNEADLQIHQESVRQKLSYFRLSHHEVLLCIKEMLPGTLLFNQKIDCLRGELDVWIGVVRDILLVKFGLEQIIHNYFAQEEIGKLAHHLSLPYLVGLMKQLLEYKRLLRRNPNPELLLENLLIKITNTNV